MGTLKSCVMDMCQDFAPLVGCRCLGVYASEKDVPLNSNVLAPEYKWTDSDITLGRRAELAMVLPTEWDCFASGWPCQPWSRGGPLKGVKDQRHKPLAHILQLITEKLPKVVILENVPGVANSSRTMSKIRAALRAGGYAIRDFTLNSSCVVPQNRNRFYVVGALIREGVDANRFLETLDSMLEAEEEFDVPPLSNFIDPISDLERPWMPPAVATQGAVFKC